MATLKMVRVPPKLLTVKEAAKQLGISEQLLRTAMKQKSIDIGFVVQHPGYCTYRIYQKRVDRFLEGDDIKNTKKSTGK